MLTTNEELKEQATSNPGYPEQFLASLPQHRDSYTRYELLNLYGKWYLMQIGARFSVAFNHVCFEHATPLKKLIRETRRRGLTDNEVKEFLLEEQLLTHRRGETGTHYCCCKSKDGHLFVKTTLNKAGFLETVERAFTKVGEITGSGMGDLLRPIFLD